MKSSLRVVSFLFLAAVCAATMAAQASVQSQQGAAQNRWAGPPTVGAVSTTPSACGNQPLCYDTPDFAVAVVDFRMSLTNGMKVMDATLRFVNKSAQPLILGYVDGSAVALDDQGNRYGTYYNKGLAGIGLVVGNSMDPKFTLQPGGAGDARFELYWRPGAQEPIGSTLEFGPTIRGINPLVGGQHTLGGEFPLRFQGLMNGMNGAAPSAVSGAPANGASPMLAGGAANMPVCGSGTSASNAINAINGAASSVGGQTANAANTATSNASNVVSQLSGLKSLFGKKNAAAPAANAAGAAPCVPAPANSTMPVTAGPPHPPAVAAVAGQVVNTTAAPAVATPAAATSAAAQPGTNPTAGAAATGNPTQPNGAPAMNGPQAMKRRSGVPVRPATAPASTTNTTTA